MARLEKPVQGRKPITMEEHIVTWMAEEEGCAKEGHALVPPPETCSETVQFAYGIAQFHAVSILVSVVFLGILFSLTAAVLKT